MTPVYSNIIHRQISPVGGLCENYHVFYKKDLLTNRLVC